MAMKHFQIIRRPIITEKGLTAKEAQHTVVFAVQRLFNVKVDHVRTAIYHGKFRRRGRAEGFRRDWKKAYVRLAEGEKMIEYAENL
jgi:large subunit ribosomal protein L23